MKTLGVCALVALVAAVGASAASPAGAPDPSAVVLTAADFPGSQDLEGGTVNGTGTIVSGAENIITLATPYGASKYQLIISEAIVESSAATAAAEYAHAAHRLSQPS